MRLHLCRSNIAGRWLAEGGYDPIAKKLFNAFEVDRILMEYDSKRSGSFAPLRFVPGHLGRTGPGHDEGAAP